MSHTIRLTVAQVVVRFLARQYSERDGVQHRLIEGCFGIFGHGNVAGLGQALMQAEVEGDEKGEADQDAGGGYRALRYFQCRNEQAMVHTAVCLLYTSDAADEG